MDIVSHIYQGDKEYRPHFFRWVEAQSRVDACVTRAIAARDMGELESYLDLMREERALLVAAHDLKLILHDEAMAAIRRWVGLTKLPRDANLGQPAPDAPQS